MYGHGAPAHPPTGYAPPQQPQQPQQQQQPMYGGPGFAPPQQPPPQGYPPPQGQGFAPGQQSPYPAAQYPPPQYPPPQYPPPPAAHTATAWKWGYSRWIGITYGPIPVGIIIAVIILIAVYGK